MKVLAVILTMCLITVAHSQLTIDEKKQLQLALAKNCQEQENASDLDLQEVVSHTPPTSDAGKCLRACLFESLGAFKDGEIKIDNIVQLASKDFNSPILIDGARQIAEECKATTAGLDRCELISKFIDCALDGIKSRGLNPAILQG